MAEKDFFISTVELIDIDGHYNIPTVLYYPKGKSPLFGPYALYEEKTRFNLNEDFKLDLGNIDPSKKKPNEKFITASGIKKSALQLTSDFMREVFKYAKEWHEQHSISHPKDLLIAEPLALQEDLASPEWLTKYRANIKRVLSGQYYGFDSISFLPEPFAVFQYYRYGEKIPILAQQAKQNALVIDFGGGTFDVCIIQTNKDPAPEGPVLK
jgi:molecular chaperone DnaK (HSP70)